MNLLVGGRLCWVRELAFRSNHRSSYVDSCIPIRIGFDVQVCGEEGANHVDFGARRRYCGKGCIITGYLRSVTPSSLNIC